MSENHRTEHDPLEKAIEEFRRMPVPDRPSYEDLVACGVLPQQPTDVLAPLYERGGTVRIRKLGNDICSIEEWKKLAPPERPEHWADGRSAKEFARAWLPNPGHPIVPAELSALFAGSPLGPVSFLEGEPEAPIRFDSIRRRRYADLAARALSFGRLVAITIEAKERETFDKPVGARLDAVVGKRSELPERIQRLSLGLFGTSVTPAVRRLFYQLLYGTAASLCFAEASNAAAAAFIVFEFRNNETPGAALKANQEALDAFVDLLAKTPPA